MITRDVVWMFVLAGSFLAYAYNITKHSSPLADIISGFSAAIGFGVIGLAICRLLGVH